MDNRSTMLFIGIDMNTRCNYNPVYCDIISYPSYVECYRSNHEMPCLQVIHSISDDMIITLSRIYSTHYFNACNINAIPVIAPVTNNCVARECYIYKRYHSISSYIT